MMTLVKKYWKHALIGILLVLIGVLFTRDCTRTKPPPDQTAALVKENKALAESLKRIKDSVGVIVQRNDKVQKELNKELQDITNKYIALRKGHPVHDTVVKDSIVYRGNECCEKLPIVERQRDTCLSTITTLKYQVVKLDEGNKTLQKQFESVIADKASWDKAMKKLDRKRKWNKIWAVTASATAAGLGVAILVGAIP